MHLVAILLDGLINSVMSDEHSFVVVLLDRFMSTTMSHGHGSILVPIKVCSVKERNHSLLFFLLVLFRKTIHLFLNWLP